MTGLQGFAARNKDLVIAVPGGNLSNKALSVMKQVGYETDAIVENPRRQLFLELGLMTMRPSDVITYVSAGAADVGVVGKDVIAEYATEDAVYEILDLGFGACRMVLATMDGALNPVDDAMTRFGVARIGSKYPRTARGWASRTGRSIEVVELKGSVELAPVVGLVDGIVDIVDTGRTLTENGLVERETVANSSARLVVNPSSYTHKSELIERLVERLADVVQAHVHNG
jgi:ATP phosphoribosyltransferase